jgi:hypothetical protein
MGYHRTTNTLKHYKLIQLDTGPKEIAKDKHSSLFWPTISGIKNVYNIDNRSLKGEEHFILLFKKKFIIYLYCNHLFKAVFAKSEKL